MVFSEEDRYKKTDNKHHKKQVEDGIKMLVKGLETEHFYFDFRHPDENDTVQIHFHLKQKNDK